VDPAAEQLQVPSGEGGDHFVAVAPVAPAAAPDPCGQVGAGKLPVGDHADLPPPEVTLDEPAAGEKIPLVLDHTDSPG